MRCRWKVSYLHRLLQLVVNFLERRALGLASEYHLKYLPLDYFLHYGGGAVRRNYGEGLGRSVYLGSLAQWGNCAGSVHVRSNAKPAPLRG
nr:hypothetical protein HmN_000905200 [Hymenolepis microstoma]